MTLWPEFIKKRCRLNIGNISWVEQEPDFYRLDAWRGRETAGHRQVDREQHHHAGHVHRDQQVRVQVVGGLVDDVDQDGWQVGHQEYAG